MRKIAWHVSRTLLWGAFAFLLALACVALAGRLLIHKVDDYRQDLALELSQQLGGRVTIDALKASWQGAYPAVLIEGVQLDPPSVQALQSTEYFVPPPVTLPSLAVDRLQLQIDWWQSLKNWQPVVRELRIRGVRVRLEQWESGSITLAGFEPDTRSPQAPETISSQEAVWRQILQALMLQQRVSLEDIELKVVTRSGAGRWLTVPDLNYRGGRREQELSAKLQLDQAAPIELALKRRGDPSSLEPGSLKVYLDWPQQSLALWAELLPGGEWVERLTAGGQFWLSHRRGRWQAQGRVAVPSIEIVHPDFPVLPRMANLQAQLSVRVEDEQHWEVWLEGLQGRLEGVDLTPKPLYLRGRPEGVYAALRELTLEPFSQVANAYPALPESIKGLLLALNPKGRLERLRLFIDPKQLDQVELAATLTGVSVDAWGGAPSASGVSGQLRLKGGQGQLKLDAHDFSLGLTELFNDAWHWSRAQGDLFWFVENERFTLLGRELAVTAPLGDVQGELRLDFPFDAERPDEMGLLLSIQGGNGALANRYVPVKVLSKELGTWLDNAIISGQVTDGIFLYNGAISEAEYASARSYDMYYRVEQGELDYASGWPKLEALSAQVKVTNDRVDVEASDAKLLDQGELKKARVWFDGDADDPLRVQGALTASGADGLRILTESPLADVLEGAADGWRLQGALAVGLDLAIGLSDMVEDHLQVTVDTEELDLYVDQADLTISQLKGAVGFESEQGLSSSNLTGQLLGKPAKFQISGRDGGRYTQIAAQGQAGARALQRWLKFDELALASGVTPYQADLVIAPNKVPKLNVRTDLRGMSLDLPPPFGKGSRTARSSSLQLTLASPLAMNFSLGSQLHGVMEFNDAGLLRGRVRLGQKGQLSLPPKGLYIGGRLGTVSVPVLQRWYQQASWLKQAQASSPASAKASERAPLPPVYLRRLYVDELQVSEQLALPAAMFNANAESGGYRIGLESPDVAGSLWYPGDARRWDLKLSRLHLPAVAADEKPKEVTVKVDPLQAIDPSTLPPLDLTISELKMGGYDLGSLSAEFVPDAKGIHLNNLDLSMPDLSVTGAVSWNFEHKLHGTTAKLTLQSDDIAGLIERFGYDSEIRTNDSRMNLDFYWPGSPLAAAMGSMRGQVGIDLGRGRFVELDRKANVLKLFGVLNFSAISRRLQLDFSDLLGSGVAFDKATALFLVENGRVSTKEALRIDGPSSDFRLSGWFDLIENRIDMRLAVSLPVTQNLPVIALLMGLPHVGGAIFVADKLLGDSVQSFASVRYLIQGDLDAPEIAFDQAFTNSTE